MRLAATSAWWLVASSWLALGRGSGAGDRLVAADAAQIGSVTEVHAVTLTLQRYAGPGQHDERARLLETLDRRRGKWTTSHARHRLLDALYAFLGILLEHHLGYSSKFARVDQKLLRNQALCDSIVQSALDFYGIGDEELQRHIDEALARGRKADKVSASQALKHVVRDWTAEGSLERSAPFACVLGALTQLFPERARLADAVKVLVPGAGLGRLGHDIHRLGGFRVTLNEWSMFMNVVYRFLERHGLKDGQAFHPFVDGWSHHASDANMQRQLSFPDVDLDPRSVLVREGDFTTAFRGDESSYDVVISYFFIDTARSLLTYLDTINQVLKRGGHWINLGPLLYGTAPFVQLSLQDIKVAEAMDFAFLGTKDACGDLTLPNSTVRSIEAIYGFDKEALTKNSYSAQFWVAKKL